MSRALVEDFNRRRQEFWRERHQARRQEQQKRTSPRNPVASNLNLDCEREVVLSISAWEAKPDPDIPGAEMMEDGNVGAAAARRYLEDLGYAIVGTEAAMEPHRDRSGRVALTGRLDFKIDFGGRKVPVEVKTTSEYTYSAVERFEDLDRWHWTRKWKGQALVYLLQNGEPEGILLLRYHGQHKMIPISLEDHLAEAEAALRLAESAVKHVDRGTLPPFTKDPTICARCWAFGRVCQPPVEEQGARFLESEELAELLAERDETQEAHRRYEAADKRVKEIVKASGVERGICGDYAIAVTERQVKAYEVKARTDRIVKIERLGLAAKAGAA